MMRLLACCISIHLAVFDAALAAETDRYVVLVSCDGFRADYFDRDETPHLDALAARGVRADALIPVFPAETFPTHYTLVTGLFPENHGIVSNAMYDQEFDATFGHRDGAEKFRARWWQGEPIWLTARRGGLASASYFWPGSETEGRQPDTWEKFDGSVTFEERVDGVLAWLKRPLRDRPRMVTLYLDEPNRSGHLYGPDSPEVSAQVRRVDAMIGRLVAGLRRLEVLASTDLVVVSDHGMAEVSPERLILLDDYIDIARVRVLHGGPLLMMMPEPGAAEEIFTALDGAHPRLSVYRKGELPERYRYSRSPRITPIVGVPDVGWSVSTRALSDPLVSGRRKGEHGYDNYHPQMHGLFVAAGPGLREGVRLLAFSAVHVYELLAALLGVEPAPNDGDPAVLAPALVR